MKMEIIDEITFKLPLTVAELTLMERLIPKIWEVTNFPEGREHEGALNFIKQAVEDKLALLQQEPKGEDNVRSQ
jgi:hypothetical protein